MGLQMAQHGAERGAALAKTAAYAVHQHIQVSGWTVKGVALVVALVMLLTTIMGLINVFGAVFHPFEYLQSVYNFLFAVVIVVMEGKPEWFQSRGDLQRKLFAQAAFLASRTGRAIFYFYVGSINLFLLPDSFIWKVIYLGVGVSLCAVGILSLLERYGCLTPNADAKGAAVPAMSDDSAASDSDAR